jgi:hypothetical protein
MANRIEKRTTDAMPNRRSAGPADSAAPNVAPAPSSGPPYGGGGVDRPMVTRYPQPPDDASGSPYDTSNGDRPLLAPHAFPRAGKGERRSQSDGLASCPVTEHHTHERKIKGYGWTRDVPDVRDHYFAAPLFLSLPRRWSLLSKCPPVYDQSMLGSCSANAIAAAIQYERMRQGLPRANRVPSRLFIYYNQRLIERDVEQDRGAQIRDGIKSVAALGACFEGAGKGEWSYDHARFAMKPPEACYANASLDRAVSYSRVRQQLDQLKGCIASGWPFVFGFTCYESFESASVARTGILHLPGLSEHVIGGHAVMAVGYDDFSSVFVVRNSWGADWGDGGYFTMPYSYVTDPNLSGDFWTIRLVSSPGRT